MSIRSPSCSTVSTDSYPSLYKSFSSKPTSSSSAISSITPSECSSSSSAATNALDVNFERKTSSCSTLPPRLKWNREAPISGRPYELRQFDIPFKPLPTYLSTLGGLGVPSRKPCQPSSKPDPFHKRTHVDEIFHKRTTDASVFSITEQPHENVCLDPPTKKIPIPNYIKAVVLADNVDSDESTVSDDSEIGSDFNVQLAMQKPKSDSVLRECKRTFFRARKELFKMRQYDDYLEEKNRLPVEVESWEISSESTTASEEELDLSVEQEPPVEAVSDTDEYKPTEIIRIEEKPRVLMHEQEHLEQVRDHLWKGYAKMEEQQAALLAELEKPPPPIDVEEILKNLPQQDFLNRKKQQHREDFANQLQAIKESQKRIPKKLPQTAAQFEKYNDELMAARRELRDEAIMVDAHYRKVGIEKEVPEKDLELKKFRAADYPESDRLESEEERDDESFVAHPAEEPAAVVHSCMTRLEWSRWMGTCTKMEKLTFPKPRIPRLPRVMVHESKESPIKMYIRGRQAKQMEKAQDERKESVEIIPAKEEPLSIKWNLRDYIHTETGEYRVSQFIPYKPPIRAFPELAGDRYRRGKALRKRKRELRKNHMTWINNLVEELCRVEIN